jgi:hypothetical protein
MNLDTFCALVTRVGLQVTERYGDRQILQFAGYGAMQENGEWGGLIAFSLRLEAREGEPGDPVITFMGDEIPGDVRQSIAAELGMKVLETHHMPPHPSRLFRSDNDDG